MLRPSCLEGHQNGCSPHISERNSAPRKLWGCRRLLFRLCAQWQIRRRSLPQNFFGFLRQVFLSSEAVPEVSLFQPLQPRVSWHLETNKVVVGIYFPGMEPTSWKVIPGYGRGLKIHEATTLLKLGQSFSYGGTCPLNLPIDTKFKSCWLNPPPPPIYKGPPASPPIRISYPYSLFKVLMIPYT